MPPWQGKIANSNRRPFGGCLLISAFRRRRIGGNCRATRLQKALKTSVIGVRSQFEDITLRALFDPTWGWQIPTAGASWIPWETLRTRPYSGRSSFFWRERKRWRGPFELPLVPLFASAFWAYRFSSLAPLFHHKRSDQRTITEEQHPCFGRLVEATTCQIGAGQFLSHRGDKELRFDVQGQAFFAQIGAHE